MNTTLADEVVLKQDVLGRVKTPKVRREQLLDEFEQNCYELFWHRKNCRTGIVRAGFLPWPQLLAELAS